MLEGSAKLLVSWKIDSGVERIRTDRTVRNDGRTGAVRPVWLAMRDQISGIDHSSRVVRLRQGIRVRAD